MIPDSWSAHHQPSVETAMRSRVDILLPVDQIPTPVWPETPEDVDDVAVPGVHARMRALSTGNTMAPSEQSNDSQDYLVQVPASALPNILIGQNGHRLRVVENTEQPQLVGRVLSIQGLLGGTEAFNADLLARDHVTQTQAG
ncbi:DUF6093 family protein [Nesterenkonia sp. K-15-9-6]|uniref:DUF6093 family protein n=1 Tax=Nesterenkonia sp. K-15-9-6 TaxID=3093918 RepID=UPI004043A194